MDLPRRISSLLSAALALGACAGPPASAPPAKSCPAGEVAPSPAPAPSAGAAAIPYDLPKTGDFVPPPADLPGASRHVAMSSLVVVDVDKAGALRFNGKVLSSADEIVELTRAELAKDPDLRAVIRADAGVSWGVVLGVLDRLKQGGCAKIAFGVTPIPP